MLKKEIADFEEKWEKDKEAAQLALLRKRKEETKEKQSQGS